MIKEEVKEQQSKMKDKSRREKAGYFWYYYKVHVIVSVVVVIALISLVRGIVENSKVPSIYVAMVNSNLFDSSESSLVDDFANSRKFDVDKHPAKFDVSYQMTEGVADNTSLGSSQKLMALLSSKDIDVLIANEWVIKDYAEMAAFANLKETLPNDLYEKVADDLIYFEYEDDGKVPIGIDISDNPKITADNTYKEDTPPIVTIGNNSERQETAIDFIRYLYEE